MITRLWMGPTYYRSWGHDHSVVKASLWKRLTKNGRLNWFYGVYFFLFHTLIVFCSRWLSFSFGFLEYFGQLKVSLLRSVLRLWALLRLRLRPPPSLDSFLVLFISVSLFPPSSSLTVEQPATILCHGLPFYLPIICSSLFDFPRLLLPPPPSLHLLLLLITNINTISPFSCIRTQPVQFANPVKVSFQRNEPCEEYSLRDDVLWCSANLDIDSSDFRIEFYGLTGHFPELTD